MLDELPFESANPVKRSVNTKATSVFKDLDVAETLSTIQDKYVVVPAHKATNNIVLICKKQNIDCLKIELCSDSSQRNSTYTATTAIKKGNH